MHLTHIIIDDFFSDPHRIRDEALGLTYPPRPAGAGYPGRNADQALPLHGVEALISDIVHERVTPATHLSHCRPRLALAGDEGGSSVHIDSCYWSAIVYLSLDEHAQGGTHFFRHKQSGLDHAPVFPGEAQRLGFMTAEEATDSIWLADGQDLSKWEERMCVPMKFNRLILLRAYCWHTAGVSFGDAPETGRLILPMFFNTQMTNS